MSGTLILGASPFFEVFQFDFGEDSFVGIHILMFNFTGILERPP